MWQSRTFKGPLSGKLNRDRSSRGGDGSGRVSKPQANNTWLRSECIGQIHNEDGRNHPRPAIQLTIKDRPFTAILDTQASHSFVNLNVASLLKPVRPDRTAVVKGAVHGINYNVEGYTYLQAKCSSEVIDIPVKVVKGLIPDIILGHDFLTKHGVVIDYTANEIFFGNKCRTRLAWLANRGR